MKTEGEISDYEKELAERRSKDAATAKAARKHLTEALNLAGFKAEPWPKTSDPEGQYSADIWVTGRHEDMTLNLHTTYRNAPFGRVSVSVSYPKSAKGESPYDAAWPKPSITCALDKTPAAIAAGILRRVLPDYRAGMELCRKANADADAYRGRVADGLRALLGREPSEEETKNGRARLYGAAEGAAWGEVRADGDGEATLELHSVPLDVAVRFLAELRADKTEKGA